MLVVVSQYSSNVYIHGAKQKMLPKTHPDAVISLVDHHPLKIYICSCSLVILLGIEKTWPCGLQYNGQSSSIIQQFKSRVDMCPNRMIVAVGQSHIEQNIKLIAVDACPPNSSICLVKSYPNSMCVCVWARTRPNSFVLVVGIHPDSMVAINGWGWHPSRFYGGCCFSIST